KQLRHNKVFVDWSQNDQHKTTVCVYSLRAKDRPTVSCPVTWDEVERCLKKRDPGVLTFDAEQFLPRVSSLADLFVPVLILKQRLPEIKVAAETTGAAAESRRSAPSAAVRTTRAAVKTKRRA